MKFILEMVDIKKQYALNNILELYQHEFNMFYNYFDDLNEDGKYNFISTDRYVTKENYKAYLIKVNNKIAGFVMLNPETRYIENGIYIAEFFIMPKYRKGYLNYNSKKHIKI